MRITDIYRHYIKRDGSVSFTGPVKTNKIMSTNNTPLEIFSHIDKMGIVVSNDTLCASASASPIMSLGYSSRTWKEVWVGTHTLSSNGYCNLTNDIIRQWMYTEITWKNINIGVSKELMFPVTFKKDVCFIGAELISHPYSHQSDWHLSVRRLGHSSCNVVLKFIGAGSPPGDGNVYGIRLIAEGR